MISRANFVRIFKQGIHFSCLVCDNIITSTIQKHCPHFGNNIICLCKYNDDSVIVYDSMKGKQFNNTKDEIICTLYECNGKQYGCNYDCNSCNFTIAKRLNETLH